jgi:hypothetical protein
MRPAIRGRRNYRTFWRPASRSTLAGALTMTRTPGCIPATMALGLVLVLVAAAPACARPGGASSSSSSGGGAAGGGGGGTSSAAACAPSTLGLGAASPVQGYKVPVGCALGASGGGAPTTIRSEEAFHAALNCQAPSGVDFAAHEVVASARMLSPAGVGTDIVDDGKTVTFVNKQRRPCPNEPPPMPITVTVAFLLPAGSTRAYADRVCTVDTQCP